MEIDGLRNTLHVRFHLSHVSDVAAIVQPQKINNIWGMGDIYMVNVVRQGIRCLLAMKNGVGVAT
jgi:hypothetical protein